MHTSINFSLAKLCQIIGPIIFIPDQFQRPPKVAPGARAPPPSPPSPRYAPDWGSGKACDKVGEEGHFFS